MRGITASIQAVQDSWVPITGVPTTGVPITTSHRYLVKYISLYDGHLGIRVDSH